MAGIKLTPARRSQLVEMLMKQNAEQFNQMPRSWGETIFKALAQGIRQGGINKLQEREAQTTKVRGANEASALAAALGEPQTDFQGRQIMDGGQTNEFGRIIKGSQQPYGPADPAQARAHLMTQNPESGYGPALAEYAMRQQLENQRAANKPPRAPTTRTVWDGKERVQQEWNPYTRKWAEVGRGEVAGGVEVNVNPESGFETPGNRDKEKIRIRNVRNLVGELGESLRNVKENPGATGMVGAGADAVNAFGDIPGVGGLITATTTGITGLNPQELARVRTQGRSMVAKLVPIITGDESGRYTDREQQRTEDIQAQSEFWKSGDQVLGGLTELQAITIRGEIRKRGEDAIGDFLGRDIDITSEAGINAWGVWLEGQGLSEDDVRRELKTHLALIGYSE